MFKEIILDRDKSLLLLVLLIIVSGLVVVGLITQSANAENDGDSEEKMTICHFSPGNSDNYQTMEISASTWETHQEHGDYEGECQEDDGVDSEAARAIEEVDLSIAKTVNNSSPEAGSEIIFTVTIENIGGVETKNTFVEDILPSGIIYQSDTASQGNYVQSTGRWNIGRLGGGDSATLEITVLVDEAFAGLTIENTANLVSSKPEDSFDGNNYDDALITVSYIAPVAHDDDYSVDEDNILHIEAPGPLANDEHIDQGVITAIVVASPGHGEINFHDNGEFTYVPDENFNGADSFVYEVCVDHSLCDTAIVTLTVNPVNDAPVANDDFATTMENEAVTVNVAHDDHDVDDNLDLSSLSIVNNPSNGSVSVNQDGTVVYTPNNDFFGTDTFEYQICDTEGECAAALVEISVLESNGEGITLVAVGDLITIDEDTEAVIAVLNNDLYNGSGVLSVQSILENPTYGDLVINNDNTITYTPNQDFYGEDYFVYKVCDDLDPQNCAESDEVIITINQVNDAPIANDDIVAIEQNEATAIHVTHDDIDVDNNLDRTTLSVISNPANGTAEAYIDGTITYTPNQDYIGRDEFIYQICDEDGSCDTAIVSISITEATGAPTVVDDYATSFGEEIIIDVLANDSSSSGSLYVDHIDEAVLGIAVLNNDGTVTYTPNIGEYEDKFVYLACSEPDVCAQGEVFVTVSERNHIIEVRDDVASVFKNQSVNINILNNDIDLDHNLNPSSINIVSAPTNGTYQINNDGSVLYTPNQGFVGADSFTYNVCDEIGLCSETNAAVEITILEELSVSDPSSPGGGGGIYIPSPTGVNDKAGVFHGETLLLDVLQNDLPVDSSFLFVSRILYQPSHGTAEINDDDTISYTSDEDYIGDDNFSYVVCDSRSVNLCSSANVAVKVFENNTPPVIQDDFVSIHENDSSSINVLANDFDSEENIDSETLKIISFPTNGMAEITGVGEITYTPNRDFIGLDELEYIACDTKDECDTAKVVLDVFAGKHILDADDLVFSGVINTPLTFSFSDVQKEGRVFSIHIHPLHGTVILSDSGAHTYTPNQDFVGDDKFAYLVCDSENPDICNEGEVEIIIFDSEDKIEDEVEDDKKICEEYLKEYIKLGKNNNREEVKKLQKFLIFYENIKNAYISGIYDLFHFNLISDFQKKYAEDILIPWGLIKPTGYVYKTTLKKINELYCARSCRPYLTDYIEYGGRNDEKEVKKLQIFLRDNEGYKQIVENGIYDKTTYEAVLGFQKKYAEDILSPWNHNIPTGYVYKTTVKKINELYCLVNGR